MNKIILNLDVLKRNLNGMELEQYNALNSECKDNGIDLKDLITKVLKGSRNIFSVQSEDLIESNVDFILGDIVENKLSNEVKYVVKMFNEYLKDELK